MNTTPKLRAAIMRFEGLRLRAYRCPAGVLTIGYGHTEGVKPGQVIDHGLADEYLHEDIRRAEAAVARHVKVQLTPGQWDALTDFVFNLGEGNLKTSTLLRLVNSQAPSHHIAAQFRLWVYSNKVKLPGLVARREWDAEQWTRKT